MVVNYHVAQETFKSFQRDGCQARQSIAATFIPASVFIR